MEADLLSDEDVFRLDVAVDHLVLVHVLDALRDPRDVPGGLAFCELALPLQLLLEVAVEAVLLNEVDAVVVPEVAVEGEDIGVSAS